MKINAASTIALMASLAGSATMGVTKDAEGAEFVTRSDALQIKTIREATREVDFVASTDTLDAHGEIVDQASWQLDDYRTNPVVLFGHQSYELPIGQCTYVEVEAGRLVCTIRFASAEANPLAEQVWLLVKEKVLRAVSVGFRPVDGRYELRDGEDCWVWYGSKLKEISVVAIPANPDALAKMKAAIQARPKNAPATPAERTPTPHGEPAGNVNQENGSMYTIEQLQKMLDDAKAKGDTLSAKIAELNIKQVETEQRADKAEAKLTVAEKALATASAKAEKLEAEAVVRETEHTKACTDRDSATKRADDAEAKLIDLEVDTLVGVKIAPTEKDDFVALRKSNESLFRSMVAKRVDMKLGARITATDAKAAEGTKTIEQPIAGANGSGDAAAASAWNTRPAKA